MSGSLTAQNCKSDFGLVNAAKGFPAVAGVLLGVLTYGSYAPVAGTLGLVMLGAVGWISRNVGIYIFPFNPRAGRTAIELWVLTAIAIMALVAMLSIAISLAPLAQWLHLRGTDNEYKALSGALSGAVLTYVAFVWTKDITDGTGFFWPSTAFKVAMCKSLLGLPEAMQYNGRLQHAVYGESIEGIEGTVGWGFKDRTIRTRVYIEEVERGAQVSARL